MVSEFRKKKYLYILHFFFDYDNNGTIEKKDIDILIKTAAEIRGWKPEDEPYEAFRDQWQRIWNGLLAHFDTDNDGAVTSQEWVTSWDKYSKNPSDIVEWQKYFQDAVFDFLDNSKDGKLESDEFTTVLPQYGIDRSEVEAAFSKASQGKPYISREEFEHLWKQFFSTDDPSLPGNYVFGKVIF